MEKVVGKEFPLEKQRDMLEEMNALKLPLLYQNLVAVRFLGTLLLTLQ